MLDLEKLKAENAERRRRKEAATPGPWRNTIRRENAKEIWNAIQSFRCSEVVVNTAEKPEARNVVAWMGPAATGTGDDLIDAKFIASARNDPVEETVDSLIAEVERLRDRNNLLERCVDPEDIEAAKWLDENTPSHEEFAEWAKNSKPLDLPPEIINGE